MDNRSGLNNGVVVMFPVLFSPFLMIPNAALEHTGEFHSGIGQSIEISVFNGSS